MGLPRKEYGLGMSTNFSVAGLAIMLAAATAQATTPQRISAAVAVIALLPLPFQFMVFMRTDIYFVLQDLTSCRDLYGDGLEPGEDESECGGERETSESFHNHPSEPRTMRATVSSPRIAPTTTALARTVGRSCTQKQAVKNGT